MTREDIVLMAPVGSYEALHTAINSKANAIYFGVGNLNMRSRSSTKFGLDDLKEIAQICKENNIASYLTVNTVIYDSEMKKMQELVLTAKESGISAIIASDLAVIQYAFSVGIPVHASTQLNISNTQAVKFFSKYCNVMVTARELSLKQVKHITDYIKEYNITGPSGNLVKIEVFIHGALCMAVSGKCYLSLHEFNKSANRGACYQTCRRAYKVEDKETGYELEVDNEYIMSPKDLKTIDFLNIILDSGVTVLKIEGRARAPEYVKTVVETYNKAIDAYLKNDFTQDNIDLWNAALKKVFNRDFWDGYYLGKKLGEWSHKYGSQATTKKIFIGKCRNYFSKIGVAEFELETKYTLNSSEELLITGPTTGTVQFFAQEFRVNDKPVTELEQRDIFSIKTPNLIRRGDSLYKIIKIDNKKQSF